MGGTHGTAPDLQQWGRPAPRLATHPVWLSSWFGERCASWPAGTAHRYAGPRNRRTARPVLLIGNTFDLSTAYRAPSPWRATLLGPPVHRAFGHTALLNPNSCTIRYESDYFIEGTLPPPETRCRQGRSALAGAPEHFRTASGVAVAARESPLTLARRGTWPRHC
jgi:TAP-like protein